MDDRIIPAVDSEARNPESSDCPIRQKLKRGVEVDGGLLDFRKLLGLQPIFASGLVDLTLLSINFPKDI
jgi:hypothetical protein